jgi:hypothetical protein
LVFQHKVREKDRKTRYKERCRKKKQIRDIEGYRLEKN